MHIALNYGKTQGFDLTTFICKRGDFLYFDMRNTLMSGKAKNGGARKTGLPQIIKLDANGKVSCVEDLRERMWAASIFYGSQES